MVDQSDPFSFIGDIPVRIDVRVDISISIRPMNTTAYNIVISPNFLAWKFFGKTQFPHNFGRIARNYAETVSFHKISKPGN